MKKVLKEGEDPFPDDATSWKEFVQWGTVQSLQYSRDGDCGNVCPKTSLVLSTLKQAQTPKSTLSLGPSWCLRGNGMETSSSPAPAPPAACPQSTVRGKGRSFPLPQAPAQWHLLTCKVTGGSWKGLMASQSTLCPELEQPKCQAELGWAKLLPSGEWAHVHAAWAARALVLSDTCTSMHGLCAQLPPLSAAHKPPAAIWPWLFSGDSGNLQLEDGSAWRGLGSLETTATKTEKKYNFSLYPQPCLSHLTQEWHASRESPLKSVLEKKDYIEM